MRANTWVLLLALVGMPACSWFGGEAKPEKPVAVDPERLKKAIQVAKAIRKDPTKADAVLKDAGLSRDDLEALMYEIAQDDDAADRYTKALKDAR